MLSRAGALWQKTNEKGRPFFSGEIEINGVKQRILIFEVRDKDRYTKSPPDFHIFVPVDDEKDIPF